jgi:hypothetical protein
VVEDLERIPCPLQAHGCQPIKRDGSYEDNPLFGYDKLNLDGIIFDCCVDALLELNRMEWSFGSSFRKEKGMMLLFTGPGFIYVCATDKKTIVEQLSRLFKVDQTPPRPSVLFAVALHPFHVPFFRFVRHFQSAILRSRRL